MNEYLISLIVWLALGIWLMRRTWSGAWKGAGLVLAFYFSMMLNYWVGAAACFCPWYQPMVARQIVQDGFVVCTIGLVSFMVGCLIVAPVLIRSVQGDGTEQELRIQPDDFPETKNIIQGGLVCVFLIFVVGVGQFSTISAIFNTGVNLVVPAMILVMWKRMNLNDSGGVAKLLGATMMFPVMTILVMGYAGYGVTYALLVILFFVSHCRQRVALLVAGLLIGYLGISFFMGYMRDRTEIRQSVWSGEEYETRLQKMSTLVTDFEFFDPMENRHLLNLDDRLNQSWLVGTAVKYLDANPEKRGNGETIFLSLVALVPRVLWPDKPFVAGSMGFVSQYTGIQFFEGTSVGMGPVFESYVNYGIPGVIILLFLQGLALGVCDLKAGTGLRTASAYSFTTWFMVGIALQNVIWSYGEMTVSTVASIVVVKTLQFAFPEVQRKPPSVIDGEISPQGESHS